MKMLKTSLTKSTRLFFILSIVICARSTFGGVITINGEFSDWTESYVLGVDLTGDVASGDKVDFEKLWVVNEDHYLYLSYQTAENIDFNSSASKYNIFIDADHNAGTGFIGGGYGIGADYLIQGGTLFSFSGGSQATWSWKSLGLQSYSVSQRRMEIKVAEADLGLSSDYTIQLLLYGENTTKNDFFPDNKTGLLYSSRTATTSSTDFLLYYGSDFSPANLNLIGKYKTVVLHTQNTSLTPKVVANLKSRGVSNLLAYISMGEQHGTTVVAGDGLGPVYMDESTGQIVYENLGIASYYVDSVWNGSSYVHDGEVDQTVWGGVFVHPNEAWQTRIRTQRIGSGNDIAGYEQLLGARASETDTNRGHNFGFDGLFMDTLEGASPWDGAGSYPWIAKDLRDAVAGIAADFPAKFLMANRGLYFFDPNQRSARFNVRPYEYTLRPYISGLAFESYYIGSDGVIVPSWFADNRNRYAPKINAEASRSDGFTVFCIDYDVSSSPADLSNQVYYAVVEQGWVNYIVPGSLHLIGSPFPVPLDTSAPVWDSTAGTGQIDPPDRIGIQKATSGDESVVVEWDVARDQTGPVHYTIYQSTTPDFSSDMVVLSNVVAEVGKGYSTDTTLHNAYQYAVTGLQNDTTYYFRVRAHDSTPQAYEDGNTVTRSAVPAGNTHYVSLSGTGQIPYSSLRTAATNIQDAINVAQPGATVYVAAGTYDTGVSVTPGHSLLNRVLIDKAITVKSIDGPSATIIKGQGPIGPDAVRCVYLSSGAVLEGFTLSNGHTQNGSYSYGNTSGGGVLCDQGGTVNSCVVSNNRAHHEAGGVYCYFGGTLNNSLVVSNTAMWGGGVYCREGGAVNNGTIVGNTASSEGAGVRCFRGGSIQNSIIYYNGTENYLNSGGGSSYQNCCTIPALGGSNIEEAPAFVNPSDSDYHLLYGSACIDAGVDLSGVVITNDLDGVMRPIDGDFNGSAAFDIGCYEYDPASYDTDKDRFVDLDEWIAGTDITNPNSFLQLEGAVLVSGQPVISWQSVLDRTYTVLYQTNLLSISSVGWLTSSVFSVSGDGEMNSYTNPISEVEGDELFFILEVERP